MMGSDSRESELYYQLRQEDEAKRRKAREQEQERSEWFGGRGPL